MYSSRGGVDLGFDKLVFFQITRENKKSTAIESFRNRNYFCTENIKKMKKWPAKYPPPKKKNPPVGGTDFEFNLGIHRPD